MYSYIINNTVSKCNQVNYYELNLHGLAYYNADMPRYIICVCNANRIQYNVRYSIYKFPVRAIDYVT